MYDILDYGHAALGDDLNRETAARRFNLTRVQSLALAFSSELSVSESLLITTTSLCFAAFNTLPQLDSGRWLELQRSTIEPQAFQPCRKRVI